MKKTILVAVAFAFIIAVTGFQPVLAEPFAPKIDVPEKMLKGKSPNLDAIMAKNSKVPDRKEVGVPAYPGAKMLFSQPSSEATINGKKVKGMATVRLGTADAISKVVAFYKERLSGWQSKDFYGTAYFWENGDFSPFNPDAMTTPHLLVREQFENAPNELMPDARAIIEILYYPAE